MILCAAFAAGLSAWFFIPVRARSRLNNLSSAETGEQFLGGRFTLPARFTRKWGSQGRKAISEQREETLGAVSVLVAELKAGHAPDAALINVGPKVWPFAHRAAIAHGDTIEALALDAEARPELRYLAACWRVGINSGAGLAASISSLYLSMRAQQEIRGHLEAELAGPRATAATLGFLPIVGIGLGYMRGAQPLTWFFSSLLGLGTFIFGGGLTLLGLWWTSRIAHGVEAML